MLTHWFVLANGTAENGDLYNGAVIAATGMLIVFIALVFVSVFIVLLPRLLSFIPESEHAHHGHAVPAAGTAAGNTDDAAVVAALGFALHHEISEGRRTT